MPDDENESMTGPAPDSAPPSPDPGKSDYWTAILGLWILLGCLDLTLFSWSLPERVPEQVLQYLFRLRGGVLPVGILVLYIPYFAAVILLIRGATLNLRVILGFSLLFRLVLLPGVPILETDLYRYLWDGRMVNTGHNPYRYSPREIERAMAPTFDGEGIDESLASIVRENRDSPLHRAVLSRINNKSVPTLYFPTAQYTFALGDRLAAGRLTEVSADDPDALDAQGLAHRATVYWKVVLFPFEFAIVFLTLSLLRRLGRSPAWVLVYAWSPLVLKEYGNTGHYDPLVVFLLLLALRLALEIPLRPAETQPVGRRITLLRLASGATLGAAIGCKAFPLLLAPVVWSRLRALGFASAGLVLFFLYLPFLGLGPQLFTGLATYSKRWEFNSGLVAFNEWWISKAQDFWAAVPAPGALKGDGEPNPLFTWAGVEFSLDAFFLAKVLSGLALIAILGRLSYLAQRPALPGQAESDSLLQPVRFSYLTIGALLLLSPVTNPWYVCWIVPFLCVFPSPAWLYLTFSQQIYYLYFWNNWDYVKFADLSWLGVDSNWEAARPLEYIPFFLLLLWGWRRSRRRCTES